MFLYLQQGNCIEQGNAGRQPGLELLDALHQELASAVPPASMLPRDSSAPTTLAITAMESHGDEDMKMELLVKFWFSLV